MNDVQNKSKHLWHRLEIWLIGIFSINALISFVFGFMRYGWKQNINGLKNLTSSLGLDGINSAIIYFQSVVWLGVFSVCSLIIYSIGSTKFHAERKTFRMKVWHTVFSFQLINWILFFVIL